MKKTWMLALAVSAVSGASQAADTVTLEFNGSGNTLADTGFEGVYGLDPSGFNVAGGALTIVTLPGDTFGQYENDPDTAQNFFWSSIDPLTRTVMEAKVTYMTLNANFHGGGIWMGTDQDHYVRLGVINNTFEGGLAVEGLRENQDLWPGNTPPGPGNDIQGVYNNVGTSPQFEPMDVILRLIRDGSGASMFYSRDNGATFTRLPVPGFTFDNIVTGPGQGPNGGPSIEGNYKIGAYAFGGGAIQATASFDYLHANSGITQWDVDGAGAYEGWTNWTLGVPSAVEATAVFGSRITSPTTVTINEAHNVGTINFDNTNRYTLANSGTASFTFFSFVGDTGITVVNGSHTISAPIRIQKTLHTTVTPAGSTLTLSGPITADADQGLVKTGAGVTEVGNARMSSLTINGGTVRVLPSGGADSGTSVVNFLTIAGGATPTATLDITDNKLIVDYETASPLADITNWIRSGRSNGSFTGNGITSSTAAATPNRNIGVAEASELGITSFGGQTVDGTAVLVRYTTGGDANLDGTTNLADFNRLAGNFNATNSRWTLGDFNYDGTTNLSDFNILASSFNQSVPGGAEGLGSAIPEPAGIALVGAAMVALQARRRTRAR